MEESKKNIDIEYLEMVWEKQDKELSQLFILQEKAVKELIDSRKVTYCEKMLRNKSFMLLFCGIVLVYLIANIQLFVAESKYLIPFIVLVVLFLISIMWYLKSIAILRIVNKPTSSTIDVASAVQKLKKRELLEMILSFVVALPLLVGCLPPITSKIFNRLDFYTHISSYLPVMVVGIVLSIIVGLIYYYLNSQRIKMIWNEECE